jgi:signal peptidase II
LKKGYLALLVVLLVLLADQTLKIWVKTNMAYNEVIPVIGNTFQLLFVENAGMAFGMTWGGQAGKLFLSLFRIAAVCFIVYYLVRLLRKPGTRTGLVISMSLILAGALGNIIDSAFYGLIFNESTSAVPARIFPEGGGYASFLHGRVVDMFHIDLVTFNLPHWIPLFGGRVNIFEPIFNLADTSITIGVIMIFIGYKRYFRKPVEPVAEGAPDVDVSPAVDTLSPEEPRESGPVS